MLPTVSAVIATYNYGHYLPDALESALAQTLRNLEILVIDDGSTDNTPEVVRPYLADPRLRYERLDHAGLSRARNTGIRLSRAPMIAFLDADDIWLPHKLERQVPLFQENPEVGVVYSRRLLIDPSRKELPYRQPSLYRGRVLAELFLNNFACASSAVVRRTVLDEVGGFDEQLPQAEDYDLWLRVALRFAFDYVDEPLVKYRKGHASLSQQGDGKQEMVALGVMRRFLKERGGSRVLSPALVREAFAQTYVNISLARRRRSRWAALPSNLQALWYSPAHRGAWRSLASLPLPEGGRRWLRRALGWPADWELRAPVSKGTGAVG
jgi:glycosyltransferase involved in cell wall biosynthesis